MTLQQPPLKAGLRRFLPQISGFSTNNHQLLISVQRTEELNISRSQPAFDHRVLIQMAGVVSELEKLAVGDAGEEEVVKPTTTEEFYVIIATLYRLRKRFPLIGFNPDFIHKIFGPLLLDRRLLRSDGDIHTAVKLWKSDRAAAEEKHGHISHWDVSRVTDMKNLFKDFHDTVFNEDISAWDTSNVTNMEAMFCGAKAFNQPIGNWNVSNVKDMQYMFHTTEAFNQPIGDWDVSNVKDVQYMFQFARAFNQPIGSWNVANVRSMRGMFWGTAAFNQSIGGWNVAKVMSICDMFKGAVAFKGHIRSWDLANVGCTCGRCD